MTAEPLSIASLMQRALSEPGMLSLAAGFTDNSMLPRREIGALFEGILSDPDAVEALQYGDPRGRPELRGLVAERIGRMDRALGTEPGPVEPEQVVITNGSQQGLDLVVRAIARTGDAILVESPTYFVFLDLLRELGFEAICLPSRDDRLDVEALPEFFGGLERAGRLERVRAAYVMGYYANPTGYSLSDSARDALVGSLGRAGLEIPVIEDAAYREFHFDEPWPASSLLTREPDATVVYGGTFTKTFSTGVKVGYLVVRDPELRRRIAALKRIADFGTSNLLQAVLARAVGDGTYDRFLRRMRPFYREKAALLHGALVEEGLAEMGWAWEEPEGGLFLWVAAPPDVEVGPGSPFYEAALAEKVMYVPGGLCAPDDRAGGRMRLSFGNLPKKDLPEAARRLVRAARVATGAEQPA